MSDKSLIFDSGFWQGAAAIVAIILSQCPLVRLWFKRPRLEVECYDRIPIQQEVGLPTAHLHISISNSGGRDVRIKKLTMTITRDGGDRRELEGRGYFDNFTDKQATLFTTVRLAPKEEWGRTISFYKIAPRDLRQAFSAQSKALKDNITAKRVGLTANAPDVPGDTAFVQPLLDTFDQSFYWRAGDYQVDLAIETDSLKANTQRSYRFTLFESESEVLRSQRDQLKYGNGVYFRLPPVEPVFIELRPIL